MAAVYPWEGVGEGGGASIGGVFYFGGMADIWLLLVRSLFPWRLVMRRPLGWAMGFFVLICYSREICLA